MKQFLKVQSIAITAAIAAAVNLGQVFELITWTPVQAGAVNTFALGLLVLLRQMFSVTEG